MTTDRMAWEDDIEAIWGYLDTDEPAAFLARMERAVAAPEVPEGVRRFEVAGAHDALDRPDLAVAGYHAALEAGLDDHRARQATIQLASSLRNLGEPEDGLRLLAALDTDRGDGLDDAVVVFRALMLADLGRDREALAATIHALANRLSYYRVSARHYADALIEG
ncbi:tetratricopeptide repeat protein [Tsukamurella sp. M9C]|uniref:tetratricopeptide repeat protein n=1 Tax=Tsukamurella sp. M9C TaxID=2877520 RepID=UPI001CCAFB5A|nr:tetratricopeptide repeat protein [Tsukamurella sp. M9C]MCA0157677.1 tetratricopeptide repeat protein [Tsukamurella sp. M9C]